MQNKTTLPPAGVVELHVLQLDSTPGALWLQSLTARAVDGWLSVDDGKDDGGGTLGHGEGLHIGACLANL